MKHNISLAVRPEPYTYATGEKVNFYSWKLELNGKDESEWKGYPNETEALEGAMKQLNYTMRKLVSNYQKQSIVVNLVVE